MNTSFDFDVFISYSRANLDSVKNIVAEIKEATNARLWMDLDGIESGELFEDRIISAINSCETFFFMRSEQSMKSEWALNELAYAKRKEKRIVIISIDNTEMTDKFSFQYYKYDEINWAKETERKKLIRDLNKWGVERIKPVDSIVTGQNMLNKEIGYDSFSNIDPAYCQLIKNLPETITFTLKGEASIKFSLNKERTEYVVRKMTVRNILRNTFGQHNIENFAECAYSVFSKPRSSDKISSPFKMITHMGENAKNVLDNTVNKVKVFIKNDDIIQKIAETEGIYIRIDDDSYVIPINSLLGNNIDYIRKKSNCL